MSFRRRIEDDGPESSGWRLRHQAELLACGVPSEVAGSDQLWNYVLLHGDDGARGWHVELMTPAHARRLLALLEPHLAEVAFWIVGRLRSTRAQDEPPATAD